MSAKSFDSNSEMIKSNEELSSGKTNLNQFDPETNLRRVEIVWWEDPGYIYIVPSNKSHRYLIDFIKRFQSGLDNVKDDHAAQTKYKIGDLCFFRDYDNRELGKWLRGIVIEEPKISPYDCSLTNKRYCCTHDEMLGILDMKNFVYRIRAIDYGFKVYKSPLNMRPVFSQVRFRSLSPWATRCKLAGVFPCPAETKSGELFATSTYMMERWLRERIMDYSNLSAFFVSLKTKLWGDRFKDDVTRIALFHRTQLPQSSIKWDERRIIESKYYCLNVELINHGCCSDSDPNTGRSAYKSLEQHIVNLLVPHKNPDLDDQGN